MEASVAWKEARLGNITGSKIACLFTEPRSKADKELGLLSETAKTYLKEVVCELLTGISKPEIDTRATQWGNEHEPEAMGLLKEMYPSLIYYGKESPKYFEYSENSGCSPDGEWQETTCIECKCPFNSVNHLEVMLINTSDELKEYNKDYWYQLQFNMRVLAKKNNVRPIDMKGLFVSYDPRFPESQRLKTIAIDADQEFIDAIDSKIYRAEIFMSEILNKI